MFGKIKIDVNDRLFSQKKRMFHTVCQRCLKPNKLNCCHIFGRGKKTTRFNEDNAVVLCCRCHAWFDSHKIMACIFNPAKRVFTATEEGFHFLVEKLGYTWERLEELHLLSEKKFVDIYGHKYSVYKKDLTKQLKQEIAEMEI